MADPDSTAEQVMDLEVKLAFQERLIRALDELVRTFATRLEEVERELGVLKRSVVAPGTAVGPQHEPPPHY